MAENGGYRRPKNPAPVSGPGRMSQRTDGQPSEDNMKQAKRYISGGDYGEGQELMDIQGAAPMAKAPTADVPMAQPAPAVMGQMNNTGKPVDRSAIVPLFDDSRRATEPITAGAPIGAGPGPEVIPGTPQYVLSQEEQQKTRAMFALLMRASQSPIASPATRELARKIRGSIL